MSRRPTFAGNSQRKDESGNRCPECGDTMPAAFWSGHDTAPTPVHCPGSPVAWQTGRNLPRPHHGRVKHRDCWSCHRDMGCDQCSGTGAQVLCRRCCVWLYPEGLAMNGPITNSAGQRGRPGRHGKLAPVVAQYPDQHQRAYRNSAATEPPTTGTNTGLDLDTTVAGIASGMGAKLAAKPTRTELWDEEQ